MKRVKLFLVTVLVILTFFSNSQITLNHSYSLPGSSAVPRNLVKFGLKGYKYYTLSSTGLIEIFNVNNTLHKSFTIATPSLIPHASTLFLSDNLFNNDTLIEYCISEFFLGQYSKFSVLNELGSLVYHNDSATLQQPIGLQHILKNTSSIYYDGVSLKMRLHKIIASGAPATYTTQFFVFNLPGVLPCSDCTSGIVTGFAENSSSVESSKAIFYPNPVSTDLKLEYKIPADSKNSKIKIYDLNGRLLEDYRISPNTDFILLPSNYNNGLYLYSLEVDGRIIKSEKIILNR